jgi:putative ABC transport system permease protein
MINKLVLENLKQRWVRTLLSALLVSLQVVAILTLVGLSRGLLEDSAHRASGTGADIFLKPGGTGFSFSVGQVDQQFVRFIAKQPHVTQAVGVLLVPTGQLLTFINGVDIEQFDKMSGGFRFVAGGPPRAPDDLIVDLYYAQEHKLHVGQTYKLLNHDWHISGIMEGGVLGRLVVQLHRLQDLTGNLNPPHVSQILVKLDDPARTNEEVAALNQVLKGNLTAVSMRDFTANFSINNIPQLRAFIWVIIGVVVVVALLVVFLSMYMAVIERTREIGILKALGAKPLTILDILVREALVLAITGCVIGIGLSFAAKALIMTLFPASLTVISVPDWWFKTAAIVLIGALFGAIYPGWKAARQDAIEALAYE